MSKRVPRTTQERSQKNRQARYDGLREELKAREYIRQLTNDYTTLTALYKQIKYLKAKKLTKAQAKATGHLHDYATVNFELQKCIAQRDVLKVKFDVNFRRLKFCLPELKSMELTDPDGESPFAAFVTLITQVTKDNFK